MGILKLWTRPAPEPRRHEDLLIERYSTLVHRCSIAWYERFFPTR